jgi:DNA replication protein DnaC
MNLYYWESNVPYKHTKFLASHNKHEIWGNLYKTIAPQIKHGFTIAVLGRRGSGKTQISCCLCWYCSHRTKKPCLYTKARDLFEKTPYLNDYLNPHLLVIDNFEEMKPEWDMGLIEHIVDIRYEKEKATLILSNDKHTTFKSKLNPSIVDRMGEQGGIVELDLPSFRQLS